MIDTGERIPPRRYFLTQCGAGNVRPVSPKSSYRDEVSMVTKSMMWVSIAVVLLALLELPVTSEPVLVEIVVCASGLLVIWQAVRAGQYLLATGFLPIVVAFSPISPIAISGRAFLWLNWIGLAAFLVAVIVLKTERTLSIALDNKSNA
jgi:hypothetical protein